MSGGATNGVMWRGGVRCGDDGWRSGGGSGVGGVVGVAVIVASVWWSLSSFPLRPSGDGLAVTTAVAPAVELRRRWATATAGGPTTVGFIFLILLQHSLPRAIWSLGTCVLWSFTLALGAEPFADPAVPSGCCREFPLGAAYAERNPTYAESNWLSTKP
jgi:hypothetical protein